jgi:DNA-binding beta-propeller fold protein YncE
MKHGFFLLFSLVLISNIKAQTSGFELLKKTVIGGEGGWDYLSVSPTDRRVYISHGTQVEVLNVDTHEKIGTIANTKGVHGICAVPAVGKGYVTCGTTKNIAVFDLKTFKVLQEIPAGEKADALLFDKRSGLLFVFNNGSKNVVIVDVSNDKVVKTLELGGAPEAGVSDGKGLVYVNLEDTNEIVAISTKSLMVEKRFSLAPGETPTGLGYDAKNHFLFSSCRKTATMVIIDAKTGNNIGQLPIGKGVDGVAFDPKSKLAFSSNGEGTFTVVKAYTPGKYAVLETIKTAVGARTITLDPTTNHIFTISAEYGEVPAATTENPRPRAPILPGTFMLLEFGKK